MGSDAEREERCKHLRETFRSIHDAVDRKDYAAAAYGAETAIVLKQAERDEEIAHLRRVLDRYKKLAARQAAHTENV